MGAQNKAQLVGIMNPVLENVHVPMSPYGPLIYPIVQIWRNQGMGDQIILYGVYYVSIFNNCLAGV